jgi:hypothetical protein
MAGEYNASIINFVPTLLVDHPRLGRVRMNAASYDRRLAARLSKARLYRPSRRVTRTLH